MNFLKVNQKKEIAEIVERNRINIISIGSKMKKFYILKLNDKIVKKLYLYSEPSSIINNEYEIHIESTSDLNLAYKYTEQEYNIAKFKLEIIIGKYMFIDNENSFVKIENCTFEEIYFQ